MSDLQRGSDPSAVPLMLPPAVTLPVGEYVEPDLRPLTNQAETLITEIHGLREAANQLAKRTHRNEWAVALTVIGLVLDIGLSIFAFTLLHNQSVSNARVEASIHEQCSLYALILPSYSAASKQRSPLGPTAYDDAFRRIQASSDHLQCGIPHVI